jgi:hypothetical protein
MNKINRVAHACGKILDKIYTNSYEAVMINLPHYNFFEIDAVKCGDGFIFAHDGMEAAYGIAVPFSALRAQDFTQLHVYNIFQTLTYQKLYNISRFKSDARFIIDLKCDDWIDFERFYTQDEVYMLKSHIIPQVFDMKQLDLILKLEFKYVVVALWRNFAGDVFSSAAMHFVHSSFKKLVSHSASGALSVPYFRWNRDNGSYDINMPPNFNNPLISLYADRFQNVLFHGFADGKLPAEAIKRGFGGFVY